ncbi:MAG: DUF2029 domain-containing protein [Anaerolineales bacterium]|nr:DUF2029 domain-containing protein [Anaerolineales bacterium]
MKPLPRPICSFARSPAKFARLAFLLLGLVVSLPILLKISDRLKPNDFLQYWTTARLLLQGENPYNYEKVIALQTSEGLLTSYSLPMYYPPWTLSILLPFGLLSFHQGQILWLLLQVGIVFYCSNSIWLHYGFHKKQWLACLIGFTFMPTFASLALTGQISPFLLLGATGFLIFTDSPKHRWLAGVFAGLLAVKPQAYYLFFIALLFWELINRRITTLLALTFTLCLSTFVSIAINPSIPSEYLRMVTSQPLNTWATPTIGYYLRILFAPQAFWLQFIGPVIGAGWLLAYWKNIRREWNWRKALPVIFLVSAITSVYTFTYDHIALLIPVLIAFHAMSLIQQKWIQISLIVFYIAINLGYFFLHLRLDDSWFYWYPLALLGFYVVINRLDKPSAVSAQEY